MPDQEHHDRNVPSSVRPDIRLKPLEMMMQRIGAPRTGSCVLRVFRDGEKVKNANIVYTSINVPPVRFDLPSQNVLTLMGIPANGTSSIRMSMSDGVILKLEILGSTQRINVENITE